MTTRQAMALALTVIAALGAGAVPAQAQNCARQGADVTCDDGRRGIFEGNAILWPDGTHSRASPHPSIIIGNKSSVVVGRGVFAGEGKGVAPLDDPNAPNKAHRAILDGVSYCY